MTPKKIAPCHIETVIAVIGGKWKPRILWHLHDGVQRYGELRRLIPGISQKMLTQHLRELERDGIVDRRVFDQKVARVEYSFTAYGETLRPVLKQLCIWGGRHVDRLTAAAKAKRRISGTASARRHRTNGIAASATTLLNH